MDWPGLIAETRSLMESACLLRGRPVPKVSDRKIGRLLERELRGSGDPIAVALLEAFDPSEKRDEKGEWTKGGGGKAADGKAASKAAPAKPVNRNAAGPSSKAGAGKGDTPADIEPATGVPAVMPRVPVEDAPAPPGTRSREAKTNAGKTRSNVGNDNEERLAAALGKGHKRLPDSEPMDVLYKDPDGLEHGFEVKTFLTNQSGHIHMSPAQAARKDAWARGQAAGITDQTPRPDPSYDPAGGRRVHVVVIDHREEYFDAVEHATDFDKRGLDNVYYARHPRPWAVGEMIRCDDLESLRVLTLLPEEQYRKVYSEFQGKSWPSGKEHPAVSRIVTGETVAQLRQLHADRKAKHEHAKEVLGRAEAAHAETRALARAARSEYRQALRTHGEDSFATGRAAARAEMTADRHQGARKRLSSARARLDVRRQKLELTASKLKAKGQNVAT